MARGRTVAAGGRRVAVSRPDKVLFPDSGTTKGDLIDYYRRIADVALPHLRGRPLTVQRFPDGIAAEGFFQKRIPDHFPEWIGRARLDKEGGTITHVIADDAATLVYLANQACVTLHVGLSRIDRVHHPDRLIFDLDPSDDDFAKVRAAAKAVKGRLDDAGLAAFVQTTGSRGLHVVAPLDRSADFAAARDFAERLVRGLAAAHPEALTVEQRIAARGDRVFLDYMRNAYGQTAVAPYSVRAKPGAPVATPLDWRELDAAALTPRRYTVANVFRRLAQKDDPWAAIDRRAGSLDAARKRLDRSG